MIMYIPKEYWLKRGKIYKEQFRHDKKKKLQEKMLIDYLKNVSPFLSVLEVGCGFGRITKLILSNFPTIKEYHAVDLSPDQIENAKEYVKTIPLDKELDLKFIVSDVQSLQIDKKYDLVITSEMLLHILPSEIVEVMTKLVSFSKMHIINIDFYHETPLKLAPHNFLHEYEKIYNKIPLVSKVKRIPIVKNGLFKIDARQSIFHSLVNVDIDNEKTLKRA